MPEQDDDWFSPGLSSVAAQQPVWPVLQGWGQQQQPAQPQPPQGWLDRLGSSLSNLAGGNPQDYLGAISLVKVGRPDPWGGQRFFMLNEQQDKVGELEAHMSEPDLLKIDWEGAGGSQSLGFANSRSVLPELMREFPNMKRYTANRVSGARYGPAARYQGSPGARNLPGYMTPIYRVPGHVRANPPNQWSGKWFHEDSGRWYGNDEGPDPRRIQIDARTQGLIDRLRGNQLMEEAEGTEVPPELSNRILSAARAREQQPREPVNTPQELQDLNRNLSNWRERLERERANLQRAQQPPDPQMSRPPTPPAPQPQITRPPGETVPYMGEYPVLRPIRQDLIQNQPMGTFAPQQMGPFQQQPMNLQMMADQLNRSRMGYGGAGSTRMEEE